MEYSNLQRKIITCGALISAIVLFIALVFVKDKAGFAYGITFGTIISILMFIQMANSLAKSSDMAPAKAQRFVSSRYAIRMFIYGVVLFTAISSDHLNILGIIMGFLSIKAAILFLAIIKKI